MATAYLNEAFKAITHKTNMKKHLDEIFSQSLERVMTHIMKKIRYPKKKQHKTSERKPLPSSGQPDVEISRFSHKKYLESFKEKAEENKMFAMKLFKDQNERRYRKEQKEEMIRNQLLKELEDQENIKQELKFKQELVKKEQLEQMMQKSKDRKEKLSQMREIGEREYRKAISATPLYKRIEIDFLNNIEMPELQKRKEELQKKRLRYKPIDRSEIREHANQFDTMLLTLSKQKKDQARSHHSLDHKRSFEKSRALVSFLEHEKKKILDKQEALEKKMRLISKKKQYSELVKDVFQPTMDLFKKQEMELIKARLENPIIIKHQNSPLLTDEERPSDFKRSSSVSGSKKIKPNKMVPEKPIKKTPVVKNYLEELREERRNLPDNPKFDIDLAADLDKDIPIEEKIKKLQKKANYLDRLARNNELKISVISPYKEKCLETSEEVNDMIIASIKAKLAILDNN